MIVREPTLVEARSQIGVPFTARFLRQMLTVFFFRFAATWRSRCISAASAAIPARPFSADQFRTLRTLTSGAGATRIAKLPSRRGNSANFAGKGGEMGRVRKLHELS